MLEIIRLPPYHFNSKCGDIHCYNAMIFSITCNHCGLITNSFEQFCLHFKEDHFEPFKSEKTMLKEVPTDNDDDVYEIKSEISDLDISEGITEFSNIKNEVHFEDFELVKFESCKTDDDVAEEEITPIVTDLENLSEIEVEIDKLPLEHMTVEQENKPARKLLTQVDKDKDKEIVVKKKPKSKYIPKKKKKSIIRFFDCKHCGRTFKTNSNRNMHELRHKSVGDFHCNLCTKTFYTKMELTKHLRHHNDERPYVCEQCGNAFRHIWVLKKHSRTHTVQERTLPCPICGKLFSTKEHVRRHLLIHNTIPMFPCDSCDIIFTQRKRLTAHKRRHHIDT